MSLYVINTPLLRQALTDLLIICPDQGFQYDSLSGEITYTYTSTLGPR
jgi:hypothetical protein